MDSREIVEDEEDCYEDMEYIENYCDTCTASSCDDCLFFLEEGAV